MKLQDIPVQQFAVRVKDSDGGSLDHLFARFAGPVPVANVAASETDGSFNLALADAWLSVSPAKEADAARLVRELSVGRAMLAELAELRTVDVVLPTRVGTELRTRCVTQPSEHQQILLHHLGLNLPSRLRQTDL